MTIQAAIARIDDLKPNTFTNEQKLAWLSEVDGYVVRELVSTHTGWHDGLVYSGYDMDTKMDTVLLAPEPYQDIYEKYMAMQMDDKYRETNEYAKSRAAFNAAWQMLADFVNRTYMPVSRVRQLRL